MLKNYVVLETERRARVCINKNTQTATTLNVNVSTQEIASSIAAESKRCEICIKSL